MSRKFRSLNPFNNHLYKEFEFTSEYQLNQIFQNAQESRHYQIKLNNSQKILRLQKLANLLEQNSEKYGKIVTQEMGKPITQSIWEAKRSAVHCRYYADHLDKFMAPVRVKTDAHKSFYQLESLGTIFHIIPFNFPIWLVFKAVIPSIALGNSIIMRPSDCSPLTGLALEELFKEAGWDQFEFQNVFSSYEQTEQIIKKVQGLSFTGSSQAGRGLAQIAGQNLKKCVMELGGQDAFIVREHADINLAIDLALKSRLNNAGQVCIAAKRFIIHDSLFDIFLEGIVKGIQNIKIGDPLDHSTNLGPLARKDLLEKFQHQLNQAVIDGGKVVFGGGKVQQQELIKGNYVYPCVMEVKPDNIVFQDEVFGPLFPITRFFTDDEAINIANSSKYGLGTAIISRDLDKAEEIAKKIQSGSVFINELVRSDSRLPSGGIKESGYGRECGYHGFEEFANIKTTYINK